MIKFDKALLQIMGLFFENRKNRHEDSDFTQSEKFKNRLLIGSLLSSLVTVFLLHLEVLPPLVALCLGLFGVSCLIGSVIAAEIDSFKEACQNKKEVLQTNPVQHEFTIKPYVLKNELMLNIHEKEMGK